MHNVAVGVSSSQVGKLRCVVSSEAFLMVATVISIHVEVAAHFTELSAPLMVHHDLVFPVCLSSSLLNCLSSRWQWLCWWTRNTRGRSAAGNFSRLLHTNKHAEKVIKRMLIKSKKLSWLKDNDVLWSLHQCSLIAKQKETAAVVYVEC